MAGLRQSASEEDSGVGRECKLKIHGVDGGHL